MKSTKTAILLRNRRVIGRAMENAFSEATALVDELLAYIGAEDRRATPEKLRELLALLVDRLYHARYFARLWLGGSNVAPPEGITYEERVFVDHVEAMYSYSRSINRFLRHEMLITSFAKEHHDVTKELKSYLDELRKSDVSLVFNNLRSMRSRLHVYDRFMKRRQPAPALNDARPVRA